MFLDVKIEAPVVIFDRRIYGFTIRNTHRLDNRDAALCLSGLFHGTLYDNLLRFDAKHIEAVYDRERDFRWLNPTSKVQKITRIPNEDKGIEIHFNVTTFYNGISQNGNHLINYDGSPCLFKLDYVSEIFDSRGKTLDIKKYESLRPF